MATINEDQLKRAVRTINKWAKKNNVDYVTLALFPTRADEATYLTYTLNGDEKLDENNEIKNDYFKYLKVELKEVKASE